MGREWRFLAQRGDVLDSSGCPPDRPACSRVPSDIILRYKLFSMF